MFKNRKPTSDLDLKIGTAKIERTKVHKFLGIHIDEHLNFKDHADKLCSKIASAVGIIRKIRDCVPLGMLRQLHYALVHSKFTYAITAYGSSARNSIQKLSNFINKSLKLITNKQRITPDVCKSDKVFDFPSAHKYFSCIKMFQIEKLGMHT